MLLPDNINVKINCCHIRRPKRSVFPWNLCWWLNRPHIEATYFSVWSVYQESGSFFPNNPNHLRRWTALNLDEQEGFVRWQKYETKNRQQPHELCFSRSNSPLSTAYSEKSHSQSDDVKGCETGLNLLMSCCAVSEVVCVRLVSDCCPHDASLPGCLSMAEMFESRRFEGGFLFFILFIASSLSSSCYEIPFSIVNLFDVLI